MRELSKIIDVHSHAVLHIGAETPIERQARWSVEAALDLMDASGIAACVLSVPDAANHASGRKARDIASRINETLAEIVSDHPSRFGALATLPGADPDGAVAELHHALDYLEMDGVATSTSINQVYLGEPLFDPWLAELNRRRSTLLVHPVDTKADQLISMEFSPSFSELASDTTRMLTNLLETGAAHRFSNIRIISTHGAGAIADVLDRFQSRQSSLSAKSERKTMSFESVIAGLASFYYDLTGATSRAQLAALLEVVPTSHLMIGFDIPFIPPKSFTSALRDVVGFERFNEDDLGRIARGNAATLFPALAARILFPRRRGLGD